MPPARTLAEHSAATSTERAKVARISKSAGRRRRTDLSRCTATSPPLFCNRRAMASEPPEPAWILTCIKFRSRRTTYLVGPPMPGRSRPQARGVVARLRVAWLESVKREIIVADHCTFCAALALVGNSAFGFWRRDQERRGIAAWPASSALT